LRQGQPSKWHPKRNRQEALAVSLGHLSKRKAGLTSTSSNFIRKVEGAKGGNEEDHVKDQDDGENVVDTETKEGGHSVVRDERDTLGLLERLKTNGDESSSQVGASEQLGPSSTTVQLSHLHVCSLDLLNFGPDGFVTVLGGSLAEGSNDCGSFL
jgi:hypothetical protein